MDLSGRTVLLTGATGGLGRAIAQALAERGAKLILSARNAEELEQLAAELPGTGHVGILADLAQAGAGTKLIADAGEFDVLVANAGVRGAGALTDYSDEEIERAIRVNLEAPVRMARAAIERMRERGSGHLVFIASLAGKAAPPRGSLYNATKFGLRGFAIGLRGDLAPDGVGVSLVSPGFVRDAGMFADSGAKPPPGLGTTTPERGSRSRGAGDRAQQAGDRRGSAPAAVCLAPGASHSGIRSAGAERRLCASCRGSRDCRRRRQAVRRR